ncbi:MAG: hypothetical protein IJE18_08505 [Bacteroidaceae bacterium]|nr:hypothetical protein [Bacteroidaceae bacterium]
MNNLKKFAFLFFAICGLISFVACEENNVEDVYTIQVGEMSDAYSDNIILQAKVAVELAPYIADTQVRTGKDAKAWFDAACDDVKKSVDESSIVIAEDTWVNFKLVDSKNAVIKTRKLKF